ncbi:uncharacterized protein [Oscarella lobularis]|uniref:uncharacterized protein isoform X2 n=1 Tax=Oscarella lobularis TaxID=121494 RepID=UPI0033140C77
MSHFRHQPAEKSWHSSLALEECKIFPEETAQSISGSLVRRKAVWQNNPVTATQLPTHEESEVKRVVDQMKSLRHPNVVQFWGVVDSVEVGVHIITEHLKDDLTQLLERQPDLYFHTRVNGLKQVANALSYLHSREICHGNLTPRSIFATDEGRLIKLSYFGRISSSPPGAVATFSDDIYSYGSIMRTMLCGYESESIFQDAMKNYQKIDKGVADELTSLHKKCREKSLSKRPDAKEVARLAPKSEESKFQKKDASNASIQAAEYKRKLDEINASKRKDETEMETLREKAKTLEKSTKERESLLAEKKLQADLQKVKEQKDTLTKQFEAEKKSLALKEKTAEDERAKTVLLHRKTLEEKMAAEKKCGDMEKFVEQMKTSNKRQEEALTEAKSELESSKKDIAAKDTALQHQKELLEETTKRLKTAIDYVCKIQSSASSTLSQIQVPTLKQPLLIEDVEEDKRSTGKKPPQEVQRTTLYTCRACSTPLVDKSFVVYLRVPPTTSITILSDYENTSKTIKTALQNVMKSHEIKPGLSLTTTLRGDFKTAHPTPDSTYIFVTPVLERYIICDPEDPSTGFYREMSLLKTNQIIVIVCCDDEPQLNANYCSKLSRLWGGSSRQRRLKELAETGRFYSFHEDKGFKQWQVASLAAALGFLPKGRPQPDPRKSPEGACKVS